MIPSQLVGTLFYLLFNLYEDNIRDFSHNNNLITMNDCIPYDLIDKKILMCKLSQ